MKKQSKKNKVYFGQDESPIKKHGQKKKELKNEGHAKNDEFSARAIYELLKKASRPLRLDDVLRQLDVTRRSKKEVLEILNDLTEQGKLIRERGGSYSVKQSLQNIRGKIAIQRSGAGFVTPSQDENGKTLQGRDDIYIPAQQLEGAWNGDFVEVLVLPRPQSGYKRLGASGFKQGRQEGRVIKVLERGQKEFTVCITEVAPHKFAKYMQGKPEMLFFARPTDSRFPFTAIVAQSAQQEASSNLNENDLLTVSLEEQFPSSSDREIWSATIIEKLGKYTEVDVQEHITKINHQIPTHFPDDVLEEAKLLAEEEGFYSDNGVDYVLDTDKNQKVSINLDKNDTDLREMCLVTIDGEDARDFDDAIFVETTDSGYRLVVAIADVSRFVRPFSRLDIEARLRANSYYFPSSVEPMLPEAISNGICSLRPYEEHRVMFADIYFDDRGIVERTQFGQGVMKSKARLTYTQVQDFYEGKETAEAIEKTNEIAPMLLEAEKLAQILINRRRKAGSLHLEIPEPKSVVVDNAIVGVKTREHFFAHELIEAFMVAANEAVAEFLTKKKAPCLYRIHPAPAQERMQSLAASLGLTSIADSLPSETPEKLGSNQWIAKILSNLEKLQKQVAKEAKKEDEADENIKLSNSKKKKKALIEQEHQDFHSSTYLAHRLILRSMMQARYTPDHDGHFGLASSCYCHFTSPIRRYADLMIHRSLKQALGFIPKQNKIFEADMFGQSANICNERERIAQAAEREIYRRMSCLFLEKEVGTEYTAVISGVNNFGLFAEITENMAEGMVRMENLGNDYFLFDEVSQSLYGSHTGKEYRLGDVLRVRLESASIDRLEIDLSIVGVKPRFASSRKLMESAQDNRGGKRGRGFGGKKDDNHDERGGKGGFKGKNSGGGKGKKSGGSKGKKSNFNSTEQNKSNFKSKKAQHKKGKRG